MSPNSQSMDPERFAALGVPIDLLTLNDILRVIEDSVALGEHSIISNYNLNAIALIHRDPEMRRFYALSTYRHIDGMPLVFLGRLLGHPVRRQHRVSYLDLLPPLLSLAVERHLKVYFIGSKPGVAEAAAGRLTRAYPGLKLRTHHGYFDIDPRAEEHRRLIRDLNTTSPDILIVGMGMPRQEKWILNNLERIPKCAILTGGAIMDYVAAQTPSPPRWLGKCGMEWAFRLFSEPRRLWRRYLLEPWALLPHLAHDLACRLRGRPPPTLFPVKQSAPDA